MLTPVLWEPDTILHSVPNIQPQLASWDKSTHPSQIRLRSYLDSLMAVLLPLPADDMPLFLHLDVDVVQTLHLLRHHDLENYLTPLFLNRRLDASRFVLVSARKFVGGGSRLQMGIARPIKERVDDPQWNYFSHTARLSMQSKAGKEDLRRVLAATNPQRLISGAVDLKIALNCSPRRNWVNLWKPTGDCLGPILGEQNPLRPFAPDDDRIVELQFHRGLFQKLGNDVDIHLWWRAATEGS